MQFFELLFLLASTFLLVLICFFGQRRKFQIRCFQIGLAVLIIHLFFEMPRWQMAFCYLTFLLTALLLLKHSTSYLFFRILGCISGLLLIATSAFYAIMMPIAELPTPAGAYTIGSTNFTITDESRDERLTEHPTDKRELFVEVWYPANLEEVEDLPKVQPLWQELYTGEMDIVRFFMQYLKKIDTHTYPDVPPNLDHAPFPVLLYNHGLQMFTSQSTLLMEHLASHGYIVVSIAHPYESLRVNLPNAGTVLPEFITSMEKFNESLTWIEKNSGPIRAAKDSMAKVQNREERAQIMLRAIENSEMNTMVSEWEKDTHFVLNQLTRSRELALPFQKSMDTSRIGIMGMSIGGAVAAEYAKANDRIKAAINIDGLQYGKRNKDSLNVPFMMIYSEDGKNLNDFLMLNSKEDYFEFTFENARHADFTDMTLIWPVMRMYGQLGDIPGERMTQLSNEVILNFWDSHLKNKPFQEFEKKQYPELEISIKLKKSD